MIFRSTTRTLLLGALAIVAVLLALVFWSQSERVQVPEFVHVIVPDRVELGGFCGTSTYVECTAASDCNIGGCSGQLCGTTPENSITTCEWKECYDDAQYGVACGCFEGKCQWL